MPPTYTRATMPSSSERPMPEWVRTLHVTRTTTSATTTSATTPKPRHTRGIDMGMHLPFPERDTTSHTSPSVCPPHVPLTDLHRPAHVQVLCVGVRDERDWSAGNSDAATTEWRMNGSPGAATS